MEHLNIILKGATSLLMEDGAFIDIEEGTTFVGKPGRKTGIAKGELVLCNIFPTDETNMMVLEAKIFHKSEAFDEHIAAVDAKRREDGKASVEDFEKGDIDWPKFNTELSLPEDFLSVVNVRGGNYVLTPQSKSKDVDEYTYRIRGNYIYSANVS